MGFDGDWMEEKPNSGKIYTMKKRIVKERDGPDDGEITPLGEDRLSLTMGEKKKLVGTHMLPDDKIQWNDDGVWRRLRDDDGDKSKKDAGKMTNMLNGLWIDKDKDKDPLEKIQDIYSIENDFVTDGQNQAPIKTSDTDNGVKIEKEFQNKEDWQGTHQDPGAIPKDEIDWGDNKVWIRLKHEKIKDLQKKMNEGDDGDNGIEDLKNQLKDLKEELEGEKGKNKLLQDDLNEKEKKREEAEQQRDKALKDNAAKVVNGDKLQ